MGVVVAAFPAASPSPTSGQDSVAPVLDVVMDSLHAGLIGSYADTAVFRIAVLEHASLSRPITVPHQMVGERHHDADWVTSRLNDRQVLGVCLEPGPLGCRSHSATAVLAVSLPLFADPSTATVQVATRRRTGGPPSGRGGFASQWLLTLRQTDGRWEVVEARVLGIT